MLRQLLTYHSRNWNVTHTNIAVIKLNMEMKQTIQYQITACNIETMDFDTTTLHKCPRMSLKQYLLTFILFLQTMGITIEQWRPCIGQQHDSSSAKNSNVLSLYTQLRHEIRLGFFTLLDKIQSCWELGLLGINCSFTSQFEAIPIFTIKQLFQRCHTYYPVILIWQCQS